MPDMLGINDFFVPEEVEHIWNVRVGQQLRLSGEGVRNNKIGSGGFGETFSVEGWLGSGLPSFPCTDARYGTPANETRICLKIIGKTQFTESPEAYLDRLKTEYQVLLTAHGANGRVPRPLGWGSVNVGGSPYWAIAMEYLPNGSGTYFLSDKAMENDRVRCMPGEATPLQVATFVYELCRALNDLHTCQGSSGITHRDLQPHNVAVHLGRARTISTLHDRTGIVDRVYLIDLGNSTTFERLATPALGGKAPRAATYQYGAPEVFDMYEDGREGAMWRYRNKPTADIWSLGALIYYYVTGLHPTLCDTSKSAPRDVATLPKAGGLVIPNVHLQKYPSDPVAALLADMVRNCTIYDPEERAQRAQIKSFIDQLEQVLGISAPVPEHTPVVPPEKTPPLELVTPLHDKDATQPMPDAQPDEQKEQRVETPRVTPVGAGPLAFDIDGTYQAEESTDARQAYTRSDEEGRTYRLITSYEHGIGHTMDKRSYANELARRIDELFLHTGSVTGDDALAMLGGAGATVQPGKGADPAYCTVTFTVPLSGDESFVMRMHLYFVNDCAVTLGLGCRCPQEMDFETKRLLELEMGRVALSLHERAA